jgi:L-iditol 2-dehydrogenase
MLYASICAGTDLHVVGGAFAGDVRYPSIIGHESIGEVVEVGPEVMNFRVGDHVTRVSAQSSSVGVALSWGGMCEFGVARDHVAMKQAGLSESHWRDFEVNRVIPRGLMEAVYEPIIITWRETYNYVSRIGTKTGDRVMISGSGANGLALAAMAKALGAETIVIGSASRRDEIERVGARALDYRDLEALELFVDNEIGSVSILIDATGKSNSLNQLLPLLKERGIVGVYGMDDFNSYVLEPLRGPSFSFYNGGYYEPDAHDAVIALIQGGQLDPSIWIRSETVFGWSNVQAAYEAAEQRKLIKPVIRLTDE